MQVEKDVPIPDVRGKYPFRSMQVGESALFGFGAKATRARRAAGMVGQRHGMRFLCRSTPEGMRIWRTE